MGMAFLMWLSDFPRSDFLNAKFFWYSLALLSRVNDDKFRYLIVIHSPRCRRLTSESSVLSVLI